MSEHRDLATSPKVAAKSGIAQRTVNNVEHGRHDPKLSTIDALARAFGLEACHLLSPVEEREAFQLLRAWHVGGPADRELLLAAAETVIRRHATNPHKANTADRG